MIDLLRRNSAACRFFGALTQSTIGTGVGYVALLVIAYDRLRSPWAISLLLLADFLPGMLLGPVLGAATDRWPRRACMVAADVIRAAAFVGIAFVDSFAAMLALALLAGAGTALFRPAALAALPALVGRDQIAAGTGLYGTINNLGILAGPAAAAPLLVVAGPEALLVANGLSFALSALILSTLHISGEPRPAAPDDAEPAASLIEQTRSGVAQIARIPGLSMLIAATGANTLFIAMINVGEPLIVRDTFGLGGSSLGLLVAVSGLGLVLGSLAASRPTTVPRCKRRWLAAVGLTAAGVALTGLAPLFWLALVGVALTGIGNGMQLVDERVLMQTVVPSELMGRAFALIETIVAWGTGIAFLGGGAIASLLGAQSMFVIAGAGIGVVCLAATFALRRTWTEAPEVGPAGLVAAPA